MRHILTKTMRSFVVKHSLVIIGLYFSYDMIYLVKVIDTLAAAFHHHYSKIQSCCCPVQKKLPRKAELAWQASR